MKKVLIVGAGFSGAVLARQLAEKHYLVDVIDSRDHVAGNAFDYLHPVTGVRIHKYGPHLFHTNNEKVWTWLQKFGEWIPYKHKVTAYLSDQKRYAVLPPNKKTAEMVGGKENVIKRFFEPYTKKMWGVDLSELDPSIADRVKIRDDNNEYYFPNDKFQALPKDGYTSIVQKILDHKNIRVSLNTEGPDETTILTVIEDNKYSHIFTSQPIDAFFNQRYGALEWRSIKFSEYVISRDLNHPTPVINSTDLFGPTRVTVWDMFPNSNSNHHRKVLTQEYPVDYTQNNNERYYPVKDKDGKNRELYNQYKAIPSGKIQFIGRCGQYVYIDMDQAINASLQIAEKY